MKDSCKNKKAHVSHDMLIQITPKALTLGDLKRQLEQLNVPDEVTIKFSEGVVWKHVHHVSFCRAESELSLW